MTHGFIIFMHTVQYIIKITKLVIILTYMLSSGIDLAVVVAAVVEMVGIIVALNMLPSWSPGQVLLKYSHVAILTFLISGTGYITVPPIPTQNVRTALTTRPDIAPL